LDVTLEHQEGLVALMLFIGRVLLKSKHHSLEKFPIISLTNNVGHQFLNGRPNLAGGLSLNKAN
jgi:hypothetical protein